MGEQWQTLRAAVPGLPEEKNRAEYGTYLVDDEGLRVIARLGLTVRLAEDSNVDTMLTKLQDRVCTLEAQWRKEEHQFSDRVQICIPDSPLLYIDEVTYLEDACTNNVQNYLDDGWRILAVCPPNAQRRPDYIFGRRKQK
jgi:hypothetical protein